MNKTECFKDFSHSNTFNRESLLHFKSLCEQLQLWATNIALSGTESHEELSDNILRTVDQLRLQTNRLLDTVDQNSQALEKQKERWDVIISQSDMWQETRRPILENIEHLQHNQNSQEQLAKQSQDIINNLNALIEEFQKSYHSLTHEEQGMYNLMNTTYQDALTLDRKRSLFQDGITSHRSSIADYSSRFQSIENFSQPESSAFVISNDDIAKEIKSLNNQNDQFLHKIEGHLTQISNELHEIDTMTGLVNQSSNSLHLNNPKNGGVLNIFMNLKGDKSLNPYNLSVATTADVVFLIYSGLIKKNSIGSIDPEIAAHWSIADDGTTYTFTLKHNIQFHDGTNVTAKDVISSFHYMLKPSTQCIDV